MTLIARTLVLSLVLLQGISQADDRHSGIDPDGFDTAVRPQDDLFLHVNGRWLLSTEIPADKSNYGSFTALDDAARENIRAIIEEAAKNPTDEVATKVGDFYRSYMNEELIEQKGIAPLKEKLAEIDGLKTTDEMIAWFGRSGVAGIGGPIGFFIGTDDKNSSRYLAAIVQSGTTLPDRDYYLEADENYEKARKALGVYIAKLFELSKLPHGDKAAENILKLETALAKVQWSRTELRDAEKRYNLYEVAKLSELSAKLPWKAFFEASGVADLKEVNVITPSYFQGLEIIVAETSLDVWKQYARFRLLDSAAEYLPKAFVDAHFELHDKTIAGVPEQKPRYKRAVDATSGAGAGDFGVLGEALGQLYVKKHFPAESRRRMDELVGNLMKTYEKSIHNLKWMTDATKVKAMEKLGKITTKIGYPDEWRDYSKLEISADDLLGNMLRSSTAEHFRQIDRLYKPVDRKEWGMTPQTVNAYYNPGMNEIVFPAAILQPPFFDAEADDAANYGGIGAVIGHEISHGFDDEGSKYDGDGNLTDWWTEEDRKAFDALTSRLVAQYEGYEPLPGRKLNGKLTLGENIADLSGMAIAYKAYRLSLGNSEGKVIDGHTASQRFFLGWSQIWRRKYREDELVRRLVTDPHSPSTYRANGPVSNLDEFYEAFGVKPGDKLFKPKEERIQIW
ncbi:MAG: M13 family peptidase [Planctomycetota bacterium]|nr:MAG: M13 family peptidase [Planctomycetota bacterium]